MPTFTYHGEDAGGKAVTETVTADDRYAVYALARDNGHTVTSIDEGNAFSFGKFLNVEKINQKLSRVKNDELVMLTRNLGSMLVAGLTLPRSISVIERQSKNPKLKLVMTQINARLNKGDQFFEALQEHPKVFDDLYVAMVRAGEESGSLAESLKTLAVQMERSSNLKKKIKGAMMYPSIVLIAMGIITVLMMTFVMPAITGVFAGMGTELPATTKFLIATSDFFANNTVLALSSIFGTLGAIFYFFRTRPGKITSSWLVTRLPIIGNLAKETNAARTSRTLASLLNAGVDVVRALEITEEVVQNVFYRKIIRSARDRVEKGTALSASFVERADLYPVLVGEMIMVGEETGQISQMLGELANFYETEVERKTKDLSTIIEPLLMLVIGGGVGFFALALIAPIYSISDGL